MLTRWNLLDHGAILRGNLGRSSYQVVIRENNLDNALVAGDRVAATQILHLPVPLAEELFFGGEITHRAFKRRSSFSSKQLRYYSYGLPVLSLSWRQYSVLDEAALLYDENIFLDLVKTYSDEAKWSELSATALKIAQRYNWEQVLRPLDDLL